MEIFPHFLYFHIILHLCLESSLGRYVYMSAIPSYNLLQMKNPNTPTYFTNRALCYLKQRNWELASQDCQRALELDRNLVKGHFFLGQAMVELGLYDEAITHLMKGTHSSFSFITLWIIWLFDVVTNATLIVNLGHIRDPFLFLLHYSQWMLFL